MTVDRVRPRTRLVVIYGLSTAVAGAIPIVVVERTSYEDLGLGSTANDIVVWSMLAGWVLALLTVITYSRLHTPRHGITASLRLLAVTLTCWVGAAILIIAQQLLPQTGALTGVRVTAYWILVMAVPALVWLPIWTAIAAVRGHRQPDRVAPSGMSSDPSYVPPAAERDVASTDASRKGPRGVKTVAIVVASVVAVAALVVGAVVADQWKRAADMDSLLIVVERSETVMKSRMGTVSDAFAKARTYGNAPASREVAFDAVSTAGISLAADLAVIRRELEDTSLMPWHSPLATMRDDYLDHIDAWIAEARQWASVSDEESAAEVFDDPNIDISSTFAIANRSFLQAVPSMFPGDLKARVIDIFDD